VRLVVGNTHEKILTPILEYPMQYSFIGIEISMPADHMLLSFLLQICFWCKHLLLELFAVSLLYDKLIKLTNCLVIVLAVCCVSVVMKQKHCKLGYFVKITEFSDLGK